MHLATLLACRLLDYHTSSKNSALLIIWHPWTRLGSLVSNYRRRLSLIFTFGTSRSCRSRCFKMESCVQKSRKNTEFLQKQPPTTKHTTSDANVLDSVLANRGPGCKGPVGRPCCQSQSDSVTKQLAMHCSFYQQKRRHGDTFHKYKHQQARSHYGASTTANLV